MYEHGETRRSNQSFCVNKEERKSYFDHKLKAGETLPDPGSYSQEDMNRSIQHNRNYSASIGLPSNGTKNNNVPGPGSYNAKTVRVELSTKQGKISKSARKDIFEAEKKRAKVNPEIGQYEIGNTIETN